ncbi:MAG: hypothetical protein QOG21_1947 [Actinomycetota bacterium]|jgi:hypothetical protein|nr:hypothetical protein [Actinomycetota bacterium]
MSSPSAGGIESLILLPSRQGLNLVANQSIRNQVRDGGGALDPLSAAAPGLLRPASLGATVVTSPSSKRASAGCRKRRYTRGWKRTEGSGRLDDRENFG